MMKKRFDDDDGRTVADMSGVERQPLIVPRFPDKKKDRTPEDDGGDSGLNGFSKNEKRGIVLGAMSATALIALVFIAVGAIAIALILMFVMR